MVLIKMNANIDGKGNGGMGGGLKKGFDGFDGGGGPIKSFQGEL